MKQFCETFLKCIKMYSLFLLQCRLYIWLVSTEIIEYTCIVVLVQRSPGI